MRVRVRGLEGERVRLGSMRDRPRMPDVDAELRSPPRLGVRSCRGAGLGPALGVCTWLGSGLGFGLGLGFGFGSGSGSRVG